MKRMFILVVLVLSLTACDGGTDMDKPVINLVGEQEITVEAGSETYEPGVSALYDGQEVDVTVSGNVNLSVIGSYDITYSCVVDGVAADEVTRTIHVVDTTAPEVEFISPGDLDLEFGAPIESLYSLSDNIDQSEDIIVQATGLDNVNDLGDYTLTIRFIDRNDNATSQYQKTVHVVDTTAPEIAFSEFDNFEYEQGVPFNPNKVIVSDNYDDNKDIEIVMTGEVDVDTLGTYNVSYYAVDSHGNRSETITKTVTIVPRDESLTTHEQYMKEHTAFYDPEPFKNGYIFDPVETVYRGVIIENGAYEVVYFMFMHNWYEGGPILQAMEFNCAGGTVTHQFTDDIVDYVYPIPMQCRNGLTLSITTYAHDFYVSEQRQWTASFSFRLDSNLDPNGILEDGYKQGNLK